MSAGLRSPRRCSDRPPDSQQQLQFHCEPARNPESLQPLSLLPLPPGRKMASPQLPWKLHPQARKPEQPRLLVLAPEWRPALPTRHSTQTPAWRSRTAMPNRTPSERARNQTAASPPAAKPARGGQTRHCPTGEPRWQQTRPRQELRPLQAEPLRQAQQDSMSGPDQAQAERELVPEGSRRQALPREIPAAPVHRFVNASRSADRRLPLPPVR